MEKTLNAILVVRADTEANFNTGNPLLKKGELAISLDKNGAYKVGDGSNRWKSLSYNKALTAGSADSVAWTAITGKPSTYAPSAHTHTMSDITNLANITVDGGVEAAS